MRLPWQVPFGSFHIAIDPLAALFIVIISLISALAAVYGLGYLEPFTGRKHLGAVWCLFNLLQASMLLIVLARNGLLFIMAWECMSLSSFFLVMFEHEKPAVRRAGWTYLTAAHLGAACLLALFVLLGGAEPDLDFDRMTAPSAPLTAGVLFVLALLGFGAKAGILPLHVWLPEAHPAAPSHVSAVMSGVMIKTGIYGLLRITMMLGPPPAWWGWTLLAIGVLGGILGVLYAMAQHDLKRLLAYSSVENIGIICMGLGLWLLGVAARKPELAALGVMGALLHVCNHAVFKSLLFLGAGAVKHGAQTLDMENLGGLQKRMPRTALSFLVAAAAICGLPPFNGFVGELLIYMAAFGAVTLAAVDGTLAVAGLITLLALSLIGVLAAACFTKVYGTVFSGAPRSGQALNAREAPPAMRRPMAVLAGLCLLLGLAPLMGAALVAPAAAQLVGESAALAALVSARPWLLALSLGGGSMVALTALLAGLRHRLLRGRTIAAGPTWDCGYAVPTASMQYTASSFTWPIVDMFRWVLRPRVDAHLDPGDFPRQAYLATHTPDRFQERLFAPLFRAVATVSHGLHWLQQGRNQLYVLYIALTVLVLLLLKVR
jgi:formate hydrogenlyase subunit 3/multisubunit Na+/H+ antiporter MnhD subunit